MTTLAAAHAFLPRFIARYNQRFSVAPGQPETAFRPAPEPAVLNQIICFRESRSASNGSTISFHNQAYQLIDANQRVIGLKPKSKITVLTHLDGTSSALYQDKSYQLRPFFPGPQPAQAAKTPPAPRKPTQPAPDHPWKRWLPRGTSASGEHYLTHRELTWDDLYAQR